MRRRGFLGWAGLVGVGILAHHKPGHGGGGPPTTTTTTTTTLPPSGSTYSDIYLAAY